MGRCWDHWPNRADGGTMCRHDMEGVTFYLSVRVLPLSWKWPKGTRGEWQDSISPPSTVHDMGLVPWISREGSEQ